VFGNRSFGTVASLKGVASEIEGPVIEYWVIVGRNKQFSF